MTYEKSKLSVISVRETIQETVVNLTSPYLISTGHWYHALFHIRWEMQNYALIAQFVIKSGQVHSSLLVILYFTYNHLLDILYTCSRLILRNRQCDNSIEYPVTPNKQ